MPYTHFTTNFGFVDGRAPPVVFFAIGLRSTFFLGAGFTSRAFFAAGWLSADWFAKCIDNASVKFVRDNLFTDFSDTFGLEAEARTVTLPAVVRAAGFAATTR